MTIKQRGGGGGGLVKDKMDAHAQQWHHQGELSMGRIITRSSTDQTQNKEKRLTDLGLDGGAQ